MKRYNPWLVGLHWLIAFLVLVSLLAGGPGLAAMANDDPGKLFALTGHMIWGLCIGGLMIVRLGVRIFSRKPPPVDTGNAMLNRLTKVTHWALYIVVFSMVGSGIALAFSADLFTIAFANSGVALPASFDAFAARIAHGFVATLIMTLVGLHLVGWAYHQFILRDRLISRMWIGKRAG